MSKKTYAVLEEYSKTKHNDVHLTKSQTKCMKLLKKGTVFEPKTIINDNLEYLTVPLTKDKHGAASTMIFKTLRIAKKIGIIDDVVTEPISFNDFCELESVKYFSE